MAADGVRCHVRLVPHRFFVRQSSDLDCAIEVVPQRLILEICFGEQGGATRDVYIVKDHDNFEDRLHQYTVQVLSIPLTDPTLSANSLGWRISRHLRATLITCFASARARKISHDV